ncbi:Phytanoyl-CoA dioxygenase [Plesiocystis pacifica SIR-1]|uniref:Phytanoyl-CoA dioxygenase n=1 Tax=Plesiocystis pacifica SIR-1 TaxID=391625 RepID=A6GG09_9BACT|nr:phytanoyl-CoA dioxygenase family protein [Plesiocystis pacifica]EDM75196.1 Phytanoyl-CoA dioxygenase [Plesiocystis pacifica SIR-1]
MIDSRRAALERDGFVVLRGLVEDTILDEVAEVRASLDARGLARSRQVLYTHAEPLQPRPPLDALMDQWLSPHRQPAPNTAGVASRLRGLVSSLLDTEVVLFQDLLLCKRPGHRPFPWHQDAPFWPVRASAGLVLWIPLAPSDLARGGLAFARGSHAGGRRPAVDLHSGAAQHPHGELGFDADAFELVTPTYARGDAVAFSPLVFHGSPMMRTTGERVAWSSAWLSADARWHHAQAPRHPMCARSIDGARLEDPLASIDEEPLPC